jgi:hypothetical protein
MTKTTRQTFSLKPHGKKSYHGQMDVVIPRRRTKWPTDKGQAAADLPVPEPGPAELHAAVRVGRRPAQLPGAGGKVQGPARIQTGPAAQLLLVGPPLTSSCPSPTARSSTAQSAGTTSMTTSSTPVLTTTAWLSGATASRATSATCSPCWRPPLRLTPRTSPPMTRPRSCPDC